MQKRKLRKVSRFSRLLALFLCLCVFVPTLVGADSLEEAEARQDELAGQKAELESELEQLKADESKAVEYQQALAEKIGIVKQQIDEARVQITELNDSISVLETKLEKARAEIQDTLDTFYKRVDALYRSGVTDELSSLEVLLNSDSLNDLSYNSEALQRITQRDEQVMDRIEQYMEENEEEQTLLQVQKDKLAEVKRELESNSAELEQLISENEIALQNIKDAQLETEIQISENEEASAALQEEITALIAAKKAEEEAARQAAQEAANGGGSSGGSSGINNGSSTPDPGYSGGFNPCWPIPGVTYVSQHYGNNGHKGIDIAGAYGTPIVAAESGEVIMGNNYDSWGDSWGYYVLIYHNGTYTTRYAHLSSLTVSTGQYVTKGQTIGYEGSTGNSTGPHLHFEVYENGYRVNPWPFIG